MDTRAVVEHHLEALRAGDLEETMADYTEESVIIASGTVFKGIEAIRGVMQGALESLFVPGTYEFPIDSHTVDGEYSVITWSLTFPGGSFPFGTDTFRVRGGKIVFQSGAFYMPEAAS
jgi:ketosteroid isomerase-like protein